MIAAIRIFIKVVEVGSFSRAGAVLNMAPSSIARSIDNLEKELSVSLFNRSTRQLVLTDKGHEFLQAASQLLADSDHLIATMRQGDQAPQGVMRISVFESFGRMHVSPLLADFLRSYPQVKIEIELENRLMDLNSENIDLAIRIGKPADSSLKARVLLPNHTLLCASPGYLNRSEELLQPDDLKKHNCLLLNQDRQRVFWYFKKQRSSRKVLVQGNLSSRGGTPLLDAALSGSGLVLLSNWMLADYVRQGKLVVCLKDWQSSLQEHSSGDVYAVYNNSKFPNPLIRLFIDYLVEKTQNKVLHPLD